MGHRKIDIHGAREHNLKNLSCSIPRDSLVVITGLSGSGKSSLAFDTLYAEGRRRYLESLSAYARQFLEQMRKPEVDGIDGLSPSISIEQKNISRNPRSTVGTVTEIYDYLRLLYARLGKVRCYDCGKTIETQTVSQIVDQILDFSPGSRLNVLAPIVRGKKGAYTNELMELRSQGYVRAKIDGIVVDLAVSPKISKLNRHDISIYIDRLVLKPGLQSRLLEAAEIAVELSNGLVEVEVEGAQLQSKIFSTRFACISCGINFPEVEPRSFSFNSSNGACPRCLGIGTEETIDPGLVISDERLSLLDGAISPWREKDPRWVHRILEPLASAYNFRLNVPYKNLPQQAKQLLLYGSGGKEITFPIKGHEKGFVQHFEGIIPLLTRMLREASSWWDAYEIEKFVLRKPCSMCNGARLKKESLSVLLGGKNISEFCDNDIESIVHLTNRLKFSKQEQLISNPILKEIHARLDFLINVGLPYLTLSRPVSTLSGGEAQRIRLATQIGSNLVGVLYILDEPSIGLHQKDNDKLISALEKLRDQGNSVIVVEHDAETIMRSDYIVDLGPQAGNQGGQITFQGTPQELKFASNSLTSDYISGRKTIPLPKARRPHVKELELRIVGANANNLKDISVDFPLGCFICVTGVSGSGKSSLVIDTLLKSLTLKLSGEKGALLACKDIRGLDYLDKVIHVDQSPIGRTPRSNPATFTGTFSYIRNLFSSLPDARALGYKPGRFSFNVSGGRCEACMGDGTIKVSMHFLPDVYVDCEVCLGRRYNKETLEVKYRGKSIADVLEMTVEAASSFFDRVPHLKVKFDTLLSVGLGYIHLGQNAVTLSGGEAQRIKLARELSRTSTGRTLYILDEPTTGLHFEDTHRLIQILHFLVNQGNTVVVIEHNMDVIKQADYIIDLGPGGGHSGGYLLFQGTPEDLCHFKGSYTAQYLPKVLSTPPVSTVLNFSHQHEYDEKCKEN